MDAMVQADSTGLMFICAHTGVALTALHKLTIVVRLVLVIGMLWRVLVMG